MKLNFEAFDAWRDQYGRHSDPCAWPAWLAATLGERERCDAIVTAYRVPVGNSPAGEIACDMTMIALREIRDEIRKGPTS